MDPLNPSDRTPGQPTVVGHVHLGMSQAQLLMEGREILLFMIVLVGGIALAAVAVTLVMTRRITAPIRNLADAAHQISADNLDVPIRVSTHDELADLGGAFTHMLERLRDYRLVEHRHEHDFPLYPFKSQGRGVVLFQIGNPFPHEG